MVGDANVATCHECGKPLGKDYYRISPHTGRLVKRKAWHRECYERIRAKTARPDVTIEYERVLTRADY